MIRFFSLFGPLVLGAFAYVAYSGWNWTSYEELRDVPKSIRNNPGIYRSMYSRFPHK